jgi:starch synthase
MSKILIVTPELAELAPVGGIAEYVFGLAGALLNCGHDVRVALPAYDFLTKRPEIQQVKKRLVVRLGFGASEVGSVYKLHVDCPAGNDRKLPVLLLGGHKHFTSVESDHQVYDWPTHEPWIVFSRAVVDYLLSDHKQWKPDVIHCQDSHTALIPVFVNQLRNSEHKTFASEVRTVLTIHNLLNQGNGPPSLVSFADLPADSFENLFEFWGQANCFKAGLLSADVVNTVSRTYAQKICQTAEYGFGLEGVLKAQRDSAKLTGIVNGIDEGRWAMPGFKYDGSDPGDEVLRAKHAMRERVYGQWGWRESDDPVIAFRGRWDNQKLGPLKDEPFEATFLAIAEVAKLIIVTWGIPDFPSELLNLWDRLNSFAKARPDRILINPKGLREQHETKAHYTIADFFFMPSKYEPCGLAQQECQRFGTIPIVRRTGGLADTVAEERSTAFPSPNGYVFPE